MTTKKPKTPGTPANANDRALAGLYGNAGVNAGNAMVGKFVPNGSMGRVSTDVPGAAETLGRYNDLATKYGQRDAASADALSRMQAGLGGYTAPEYQAQREQMMQGVNSNFQTGWQQLAKAQARGKVYGAAASAQQANAVNANNATKDDLEQKLMVQNIDEKQKRLNEYGQYNSNLVNSEYARQSGINNDRTTQSNLLGDKALEREKFNIGSANAEQAAQIGLFTGTAGQGLSAAQTRAAQKIQRDAIARMGGKV